jgi:hypothetical protein
MTHHPTGFTLPWMTASYNNKINIDSDTNQSQDPPDRGTTPYAVPLHQHPKHTLPMSANSIIIEYVMATAMPLQIINYG